MLQKVIKLVGRLFLSNERAPYTVEPPVEFCTKYIEAKWELPRIKARCAEIAQLTECVHGRHERTRVREADGLIECVDCGAVSTVPVTAWREVGT